MNETEKLKNRIKELNNLISDIYNIISIIDYEKRTETEKEIINKIIIKYFGGKTNE